MSNRCRSERRWQCSLGELLLLFTFVAAACSAAKFIFMDVDGERLSLDFLLVLGGCLIPGLICCGIGIKRRRLIFWLSYAIALDLLILGLAKFMASQL